MRKDQEAFVADRFDDRGRDLGGKQHAVTPGGRDREIALDSFATGLGTVYSSTVVSGTFSVGRSSLPWRANE